MKSKLMLFVVLLLLGMSLVPAGNVANTPRAEVIDENQVAGAFGPRTMKIPVEVDVSTVNASRADTNFGGEHELFIGTGLDYEWVRAWSWFKFNLIDVPREITVRSAYMHAFLSSEWSALDEPLGAYYSSNDTWGEYTITWNNQPSIAGSPSDVIDSPASPDMFVPGNWYEWDVTEDVRTALLDNQVLTEVLKQTDEVGSQNAFNYIWSLEGFRLNASYLSIEYDTPEVSSLTVEGIGSGALLDYIQDCNPELGWQFSDQNPTDFQKDYDVEVWDNEYYNGSMLWKNSHEQRWTIHNSFGAGAPGNTHPFGLDEEFRIQMKYLSSDLPRSGVVDKLYFTTSASTALLELVDFEVAMLMTPDSSLLTTGLEANFGGRQPTVVLSEEDYQVAVVGGVLELDLENSFFLDSRMNLIIEIRHRGCTEDRIALNRTVSAGPGSVAAAWGPDSYFAAIGDYASSMTYDLKIGFLTQNVFNAEGGGLNSFPFDVEPGTPGRFQIKYNQSFVNREGYIDRLYFRVADLDTDVVYENFRVVLCETPVKGPLGNVTWVENYGGATPQVMLEEDLYVLQSLGRCLVIDLPNTFYYTNTHDLLIEFQWDALVSGAGAILSNTPTHSSYRTWDLYWIGLHLAGQEIADYDLLIDFVNGEDSVDLVGCITLVNETRYYWRARACDSTGTWSDWETLAFTYQPLTSVPTFSEPWANPDPAVVGREVTISINATYFLGMGPVSIEIDGINRSMSGSGGTFSYSMTPSAAGNITYTIYMTSAIGTVSTASGLVEVNPAGGLGSMLIIVVGAAAVVVVAVLVFYARGRGGKET